MRDLGGAGEGIVESWCSIAGITANKSLRDRYGWDFVLEMQSSHDIRSAAGLHESNLECKVQVKTTDNTVRSQQITLSNLKAMATTLLPTFYLLLEYAGGSEPVAAFLLHVDNELCGRILKRIRSDSVKSQKLDLNRKKMTLNFSDEMRITPLGGEGLRSAIRNCIGGSQGKYVEAKQAFLRTAGYEESGFSVRFDIDICNTSKFIDMLLGRGGQVEVKQLTSFETRFGIAEERTDLKSATAIVELSDIVPCAKGVVRFRDKLSGGQYDFDVDVFQGGMADWVPDELKLIRLEAAHFQIEISFARKNFKLTFYDPGDEGAELVEALKLNRAMELLTFKGRPEMEVTIGDKKIKGSVVGEVLEGDYSHAADVLDKVLYVKNYFNHYDTMRVSGAAFRPAKNFLSFHAFISGQLDNVTLSFSLPDSDVDSAVCLLALPTIVGGICFVGLFACMGELQKVGVGEYSLDVNKVLPVYRSFFKEKDIVGSSVLTDLKNAADAYVSDSVVIEMSQKYVLELIESVEKRLCQGH